MIKIVNGKEKDPVNRGNGHCGTDLHQAGVFSPAEQIGQGNPYQEGRRNPLEHYRQRLAASIEIAYIRKYDTGQDGFRTEPS